MKNTYLWKILSLVACLLLSLFVASCQKEKDEETLRREVIANAEQVMDNVGIIFKSSETIEAMASHLSDFKAMANVEDAWQDGEAICVKIKDGGVIMWQYYPEDENPDKSIDVKSLSWKDARKTFQSKDGSMCEEKSICLLNVINRSWETGYDEIIAKYKDSLNWDTCVRKSEQVSLDFILNRMPEYGAIIFHTHGGYFSDQHWLLTGEPWSNIRTSDEYKDWIKDRVRASLVRSSDDYHLLISETYLLDKLPKQFHHNSVMFSAACQTLKGNHEFCKKLIREKGLGCFVGFNETVYGLTDMNCCVSFFNEMFHGATAIEACAVARNEITQKEREERSLQLLCYPNTCDITLVEPPDDPDEEPGLFSVSPTKKVFFSPGNLQYQASTNTWRFAEHQYDYVGDSVDGNVYENGVKCDNALISNTYSGWIDLFGWGTGDNPTCCSAGAYSTEDYSNFVDWGANAISNGGNQPNIWRTLSEEEWDYLINKRRGASFKYGFGKIDTICGLIILPNRWTIPDRTSFIPGAGVWEWDNMNDNSYSIAQWAKMEEAGAIFIPGSPRRHGSDYFFGAYKYGCGCLWTSTPINDLMASGVYYDSAGGTWTAECHRYTGLTVRLVRDKH